MSKTINNILELKNITKKYPGVVALNSVSFKVKQGDILSIVGENGAGKSTLLKVISGVIPHNKFEGRIIFNGKEVNFTNPKDSEKAGIAIIHQELAIQPHLTLYENIFQGSYIKKFGITNWNKMIQEAKFYLHRVGLKKSPESLASSLSVAEQQLIEIAKALAKKAKLLILDEPTSSLNDKDAFNLLDRMRELQKEGVTCMFVSHKLNEVEYVADAITVIRDGNHISDYNTKTSEVTENKLIKDIVGRSLDNKFPNKPKRKLGEIKLEVKNLSVDHHLIRNLTIVKNSSLYVKAGEIVGLSGLVGSGRSELAMNVFGKSFGIRTSGQILINGKEERMNNPLQAIKKGLMYATEDRKETGMIQIFSVHNNFNSAANHIYSNDIGVMRKEKEVVNSNRRKEEVNVKVPSIDYKVETLSGGNQQKVLIGKALTTEFDTLIIDEPTKGIDVGSKYEIYKIIHQLADQGKAIIVISSELEELIGITDRIYVMSQGEIRGQIKTKDATPEKIMQIAIGKKKIKGTKEALNG